jgi:sterol desaturase/sphingolipid hydroxylase (fatty acid hydroxylase superfamily)
MMVLLTFLLLSVVTLALRPMRQAVFQRRANEWGLDLTGLIAQGIIVPLIQTSLIYSVLYSFAPELKGTLNISPLAAFLLNFVAVDYLYYWNHRWLHSRWMWSTHATHHTAEAMDVFITSRNTLWTSLLIVYVWINGLFLFLLHEPAAFLLAASLTASLDLWRHTRFSPRPGSLPHRGLSWLLITPHEHAWHHSRIQSGGNFGANLSLWDRLHRTWFSPATPPENLGIPLPLSWQRKLVFPFVTKKAL